MAGNGGSKPKQMRARRWAAIAAVGLTLSLAGIQVAFASPSGNAAASRATRSVSINHFAFHPPTLRVARGATVAFVNSSGTAHTATDRGGFDTGRIPPGKSVSVRFARKGTFAYHCTIHPFMHGRIVVE